MAAAKKPQKVEAPAKRKNVSVKLSNEELKQLRQMALDTDSSSVDIATRAIREVLRKHSSSRK